MPRFPLRSGLLLAAWLCLAAAPLFPQQSVTAGAPPSQGDSREGFDEGAPPAEEEGAAGGPGEGSTGEGDLLEGFGERPAGPAPSAAVAAPAATAPAATAPAAWELSGSLTLDAAYNYQEQPPVPQRGLSRLRPVLRLELQGDLGAGWDAKASGIAFYDFAYSLKGRDRFTPQVLDRYEEEVEFRELFVRGSPVANLDLQVGRQVVVWGVADYIRVVDVLNPLENREPGMADIEDLRLPVAMTRVAWFQGDWRLTGVAIHEIAFNKEPVPGSDFYPLPARNPFGVGRWPPREEIPGDGGANTEYGLSLAGTFTGWDLAFYWAQFYEDTPHLENVSRTMVPDLRLIHSRLTLSGLAAQLALGNWLLKGEAAQVAGLRFFDRATPTDERLDLLVGVEYAGFNETTLALEAVDRHLLDYDPALAAPPDEVHEDLNQYALAYSGHFLHQTLTLRGVWLAFGARADEGLLQRYSAEYDLTDDLSLTGGVLIFQSAGSGNPLFQVAARNDRLFLALKYSF